MLSLDISIPILVIEDEESDVMLVRRILKAEGVDNKLHICNDANEALSALSEPPLLGLEKLIILLDIGMPGIDGALLLDFLCETPTFANYHIIIHSASELPEHQELVQTHGLAGYLLKPFDFDKFCALVNVL